MVWINQFPHLDQVAYNLAQQPRKLKKVDWLRTNRSYNTTKELAQQVERVTEIVAQSNISLFSRVQINIEKPEGDRTPELLYALRLYLTGDDDANAIHIASVNDDN